LSLPNEPRKAIDVLLVEDDPGDTLMIREAFEHHAITHTLHHVPDGVEALAFLHGEREYAGSPRPDLVLLDLNLPRMDGRQVLKEVKADPDLRAIPIVVLTTSEADEDILRSYELYANAYVTKPVDFDRFIEAVRMTDDFFMNIVKLPRR
jgi:CheY-like chemotaxis protein